MASTDQSTADLWRTIVGTAYQESVLAYGNMHSNHSTADDEHLPRHREDARYAALTILSAAVGVPVPEISRLASEAAYRHGFYHDADYVDYLAEPDWDAVRDGTYTPRGTHRDPWPDDEPDEDDDVAPDEYLYDHACQTAPDGQVWYGPDDIGPLNLRPGVDPLDVLNHQG